jgi:hypothetical protein
MIGLLQKFYKIGYIHNITGLKSICCAVISEKVATKVVDEMNKKYDYITYYLIEA